MTLPTIGRIVHVLDVPGCGAGPYAAIVTAVRDDDTLALTVFLPMATPQVIDGVAFFETREDAERTSAAPTAYWPPRG